ncbi:ferredoxin [Sulfuricella sp. T08]|uniref:2Fe-2S iron-sulfur cluster-binding protein n=1 Tax=Sulfuricella sp. T08 TaxID=1632857 RepID=UPI0006179FDF|nr:2Fe-2S iron-sulfur cluster-binding protein [Sulfuricella sp. T08]GAO35454.1 ferredoxin [Sulfuricella sp. T08]
MAAITFLNPGLKDKVRVIIPPGSRATLLKLAKDLTLPLRCNCESGDCGTCAVKVVPLHHPHGNGTVRLGELEKNILFQAGKLSWQQYDSDVLKDMPPLWRLACQYQVKDEDILVAF